MEELDRRKRPVFVCVTCENWFVGMNIVEGDRCPCGSGLLQWAYTPVVDDHGCAEDVSDAGHAS